jgi:hypothetical protein
MQKGAKVYAHWYVVCTRTVAFLPTVFTSGRVLLDQPQGIFSEITEDDIQCNIQTMKCRLYSDNSQTVTNSRRTGRDQMIFRV